MLESGAPLLRVIPGAGDEIGFASTAAGASAQKRGAAHRPQGDRIGTLLQGTYRIDAMIGEGGCGRVYRATHIRLQRTVA